MMQKYVVEKKSIGSGGFRTHASEETGALNQRLRPLGHATLFPLTHYLVFHGQVTSPSQCEMLPEVLKLNILISACIVRIYACTLAELRVTSWHSPASPIISASFLRVELVLLRFWASDSISELEKFSCNVYTVVHGMKTLDFHWDDVLFDILIFKNAIVELNEIFARMLERDIRSRLHEVENK